MHKALLRIEKEKVVAIIRDKTAESALKSAEACLCGGLGVIEITLNTPGALEVIQELTQKYPETLFGAGTALDIESTEAAIRAGAKFIVSPHTDKSIITLCKKQGIMSCPGTSTPTEMLTAHNLGADLIKVFPIANLGGPSFIKNVRGPLSHLRLIPTGNVRIEDIEDYFKAGVFAVGLSGALFPKFAIQEGNYQKITEICRQITTILDRLR
jgi:2-dehydro-3-deoxyphosphogluconate aldolase/(4S)-4-hydroxy-2-oxoglutarate aldolase